MFQHTRNGCTGNGRAGGMLRGLQESKDCQMKRMPSQALAAGAPDILRLALDSGYGCHEALTRAAFPGQRVLTICASLQSAAVREPAASD